MIASAIDAAALLKMIYSSLLAGVSVTVVFSLAILGVTRSTDMRRSGRNGVATFYGILAGASLILVTAIVIYGLIQLTRKS